MLKLNGTIVNFKTFASGESFFNEELNLPETPDRFHHVEWKYKDDSEVFQLACLLDHINRLTAPASHGIKLTIHYMPHARMDRFQSDAMPFTLDTLATMLGRMSPLLINVISPHSPATYQLLCDSKERTSLHIVRNIEPKLVTKALQDLNLSEDDIAFVFPDEGAKNRYIPMFQDDFKDVQFVVGEKKRDFNTGKIQGLEIDQDEITRLHKAGKRFIIVDDICN